MRVADVVASHWAIMPEKLREIEAFYSAYARGEKIDIASIEARIGKPLASADQGYQVVDGVAVIPINGVIGKKMNLMSQISGGASSQLIARDVKAALSDSSANSILLHIDSPGGTVDGTQTLADVISAAGNIKPVVAFADGTMASAAYWIGSAASQIIASSGTATIGSIGVVTSHTDISGAEAAAGIKTTEISAGKYKRMASEHAPLSKDGKAYLQDQVDQLYTIFVDAVAENRGVSADVVLDDMADGRVFLAQDAMDAGLIDGIASLEETIYKMSTGVWPKGIKKEVAQAEPVAQVETIKEVKMDIKTLKENHPDIAAELMEMGAVAERARILACESAGMAGHEALVNTMKFDGKSSAGDIALAIIGAEKTIRSTHLADFKANAPAPVPHAAVPAVEVAEEEDISLPIEDRAKASWDKDAKLRAEFGGNFATYAAYAKAMDSGSVKVHGTH